VSDAGDRGAAWWPKAYDPSCAPVPADGKHSPGSNCQNCHESGPAPMLWEWAGTIYLADEVTPAPKVEIGVKSGATVHVACSADNGNFWLPKLAVAIDWASAEVRTRDANGESPMISKATGACNSCHAGGLKLTAP
jgi:hypothetical protein